MKIIFASNARFGQIILDKLIDAGIKPDTIITSSDKRIGRGQKIQPNSIKELAVRENILVKEVDNKEDFHRIIEKESPAVVIVAAFGIIILEKTLSLSTFFNVHPSLLPKYRGATPIQTAIQSGEKENGITIIKMNRLVDAGNIVSQKSITFKDGINYIEAEKTFGEIGAEMLQEVLNLFDKNQIMEKEQNNEKATFTKTLSKEDGKINWSDSAEDIKRKIEALNPWPGTYTKMGEKIVKVLDADIQKQTEAGPFGEHGKVYLGTNNTLAVQTGKDFLLIKELQVEGKTATSSKDFLQGNMSAIGIILE